MNHSMKALIQKSIGNMNSRADSSSPYEFEEVGQIMAEEIFGVRALRASGSSAGGDGGEDGSFVDRKGNRFKIACSVCKKEFLERKIKAEMAADPNGYVFFCTNQEIIQMERAGYKKKYPNIEFADINDITDVTEGNHGLKEIFGIPDYESRLYIEELRRRHQFLDFENQINGYIERKVVIKKENNRNDEVPFLQWAMDTESRLKLLEAPAGYGKTCLMKKLYMNLLSDDSLLLPPVYCDLKNFKGISSLIDEMVGRGDGFGKYDFYFIFDGLDEIPEASISALVSEIDNILSFSTNHRAMVILAARKNEYQKELFKQRIEPEIAQIKALDKNDVKEMIAREGVNPDEAIKILAKLESLNYYDNVFYVSSILLFYSERKGFPGDEIELFEYLLERDIDMLGRKHTLDKQMFNVSVLYLTLTKGKLSDEVEIFQGLPTSTLDFSHRNILEYAAAKALATLSSDKIISLVSSKGIIVPQAKNTFGFLLNILAGRNFGEAKKLLDHFHSNALNYETLLLIEPDKIPSSVRRGILKDVLEYYLHNTYYDIPYSLCSFVGAAPSEAYGALLGFIKNCDVSHVACALRMADQIIRHKPESCPQEVIDYLYKMFLVELSCDSKMTPVLNELAYILRHVDERLSSLSVSAVGPILAIAENSISDPEFVMSLFVVLKKGITHLTDADMSRVIECFFSISKENTISVDCVPTQVSTGYTTKPVILFRATPVYDIAYEFILNNHHSFFFSVLEKYKVYLSENRRVIDSFDSFSDFIARTAVHLFNIGRFPDEDAKTFIDVILAEYEFGQSKSICVGLIEDGVPGLKLLCKILIAFHFDADYKTQSDFVFQHVISRLFTDVDFFSLFKEVAGESFDDCISYYFHNNPLDTSSIPASIKNCLPDKISDEMEKQEALQIRAAQENKRHANHIEESFHIVFADEDFMVQTRAVFDKMEKTGCKVYCLEYTHDYKYSYINQFVIDAIHFSKYQDYNGFIAYWFDAANHDVIFLYYLIRYFEFHNISFSLLREDEVDRICQIAGRIFNTQFSREALSFILLSILMRQPELAVQLKEVALSSSFPLTYFIDGMPRVISKPLSSLDLYDFYSVDYLENYLSPMEIEDYLIDNFQSMLVDDRRRIVAIGYMTRHKSSSLQYEMKTVLKPIIVEFISTNLSETTLFSGFDFLSDFGVVLDDFEICKLAKHVSSINSELDPYFVHNTAYEIIYYFSRNGLEHEKKLVADCFELLFKENNNILCKKLLAEAYIAVKSDSFEINHWYVDYCLSEEGVLSRLYNNNCFVFTSENSISDLERMIVAADLVYDDKHKILFRLAINSYKAIFNKLISSKTGGGSLDILFRSLDMLRDKTNSFNAIELMNDMEKTVAFNSYSVPDLSTMKELFEIAQ